jgi:hypothetical protein
LQDLSLYPAIAPQHPGIPDENDFGRWFCLRFPEDGWPQSRCHGGPGRHPEKIPAGDDSFPHRASLLSISATEIPQMDFFLSISLRNSWGFT